MATMVATTGTEVMTNGSSRVYRGDKGLSYVVVVLGAGQRDVGCHPATTHTASRNSLLLAARTTGGTTGANGHGKGRRLAPSCSSKDRWQLFMRLVGKHRRRRLYPTHSEEEGFE